MPITKPHQDEYPGYYHTYIGKVPQTNLLEALHQSSNSFVEFIQSIPQEKHDYRYADGKWTIKQVVAHIIDCERVFAYRALSFARNDKSELPGFDENAWAVQNDTSGRSMESLLEEYKHVRQASHLFFEALSDEAALRKGKANGNYITVRSIGFILSGHEIHHMQVLKERYLS